MKAAVVIFGSKSFLNRNAIHTAVTSITLISAFFPLKIALAEGNNEDDKKDKKEDFISMIARNGKKATESSDSFGSILKDFFSSGDKFKSFEGTEKSVIKDILESGIPGQLGYGFMMGYSSGFCLKKVLDICYRSLFLKFTSGIKNCSFCSWKFVHNHSSSFLQWIFKSRLRWNQERLRGGS